MKSKRHEKRRPPSVVTTRSEGDEQFPTIITPTLLDAESDMLEIRNRKKVKAKRNPRPPSVVTTSSVLHRPPVITPTPFDCDVEDEEPLKRPKIPSTSATSYNINQSVVTPLNQEATAKSSDKDSFNTRDDSESGEIAAVRSPLLDLYKALDDAITWKQLQTTDKKINTNPLILHLETKYKEESLEKVVFRSYPGLKAKYEGTRLQALPLSLRLFLLSLCATLFGLPTQFNVHPWDLVASAWSSDILGADVEQACKSALDEFVHSFSWKTCEVKDGGKETETREKRVASFKKRCKTAMKFPTPARGNLESFCKSLKKDYKAGNCVMRDILTSNTSPKPDSWNIETKIFLHAMIALTVQQSGLEIVVQCIAGCSEPSLIKLKANTLMEQFINEFNIENSVVGEDSFGQQDGVSGSSELDSFGQQDGASVSSELEEAAKEERRRMQIALEVIAEQAALAPTERDSRIQDALHNAGYQVLKEEEVSGVSKLQVGEGKGKHQVDYIRLPRRTKKFSESNRNSQSARATLVKTVIEHQAGLEEHDQDGLANLLVKKCFNRFVLLPIVKNKFVIAEISAIRCSLKLSGNQMNNFIRSMIALKPEIAVWFPRQLKKQLREYEESNVVPQGVIKLPLKMNANGDEKMQVFTSSEEPWHFGSKQIEAAFIAGRFEESETFSYHKKRLVVIIGMDKDTGQTTLMQRFANRKDGNSNESVATIAFYEKAAECYRNISETLLKEGSPTKNYVQLTLNDRFFVLCVNLSDGKGKVVASRCVYLNLFSFPFDDVKFPDVKLNLRRKDDVFCSREDHNSKCSPSGNTCIGLTWNNDDENQWNKGSKFLALELVWDTPEEEEEYHGFRLYLGCRDDAGNEHLNPEPFYQGKFEESLLRHQSATSCELLQTLGISSSDKKNAWIVSGMHDSWAQSCNCITCMQPHATYKTESSDTYDLRRDRNSVVRSYLKWREATKAGKLTKEELLALKILCGSVHRLPLLFIDPSKHQCGGLHVSAGIINHLVNNLMKALRAIDEKVVRDEKSWMEEVEEVKRDCQDLLADQDGRHKELTKQTTTIMRDIRVLRNILERAADPQRRFASTTEESVQNVREELHELETTAVVRQFEESEFLRNGAKSCITKIKDYKTSKKPKGVALYSLLAAIQCTGCSFQAQHGGTDLTNADALSLLQNWDWVVDVVCGAYEVGSARHAMVRKVMEDSKLIVNPLYKATKMMKSQRKWDDADLEKYIQLSRDVQSRWLTIFPKQGVFPKMHDFVEHIPQFIREHGFYGRGSEESFESYHTRHKVEAANVQYMKNDDVRIATLNRRLQLSFNPENEALCAKIRDGTQGKKRGKYKVKEKETSSSTNNEPESRVDDNSALFVEVDQKVKRCWNEVYRMAVAGEVPISWRLPFLRREDLSDAKKQECIYSC